MDYLNIGAAVIGYFYIGKFAAWLVIAGFEKWENE